MNEAILRISYAVKRAVIFERDNEEISVCCYAFKLADKKMDILLDVKRRKIELKESKETQYK
jgi:hypothetical protein